MKELRKLAESLKTPTYKLGIGSPLEVYNRGWNEGQEQAAKQLEKIIKDFSFSFAFRTGQVEKPKSIKFSKKDGKALIELIYDDKIVSFIRTDAGELLNNFPDGGMPSVVSIEFYLEEFSKAIIEPK